MKSFLSCEQIDVRLLEILLKWMKEFQWMCNTHKSKVGGKSNLQIAQEKKNSTKPFRTIQTNKTKEEEKIDIKIVRIDQNLIFPFALLFITLFRSRVFEILWSNCLVSAFWHRIRSTLLRLLVYFCYYVTKCMVFSCFFFLLRGY